MHLLYQTNPERLFVLDGNSISVYREGSTDPEVLFEGINHLIFTKPSTLFLFTSNEYIQFSTKTEEREIVVPFPSNSRIFTRPPYGYYKVSSDDNTFFLYTNGGVMTEEEFFNSNIKSIQSILCEGDESGSGEGDESESGSDEGDESDEEEDVELTTLQQQADEATAKLRAYEIKKSIKREIDLLKSDKIWQPLPTMEQYLSTYHCYSSGAAYGCNRDYTDHSNQPMGVMHTPIIPPSPLKCARLDMGGITVCQHIDESISIFGAHNVSVPGNRDLTLKFSYTPSKLVVPSLI